MWVASLLCCAWMATVQVMTVNGLVCNVDAKNHRLLVDHEAIPGYMEAMTMPFNVKEPQELAGLRAGDRVSFRLHVTEDKSWIEGVKKTGNTGQQATHPAVSAPAGGNSPTGRPHPLLTYKFTNELGQAVSLADFRGQALALTFFFTRCPVPDFCPRLSKNFEQASARLAALPGGPTNWHFLSISFDPIFDTPSVLKSYAGRYHHDPAHWSFLTGPLDKIGELARLSDVTFEPESGFYSHNFRTFVIDATGRLQTIFPTSGDLTDGLVGEMRKAALAGQAERQPEPLAPQ
jgi:protein SCO1